MWVLPYFNCYNFGKHILLLTLVKMVYFNAEADWSLLQNVTVINTQLTTSLALILLTVIFVMIIITATYA